MDWSFAARLLLQELDARVARKTKAAEAELAPRNSESAEPQAPGEALASPRVQVLPRNVCRLLAHANDEFSRDDVVWL